MIYDVHHRTTYRYEDEVAYSQCVLRLTPRTTAGQTLLQSAILVDPEPAERQVGLGAYGEQVLRIIIDTPHRKLVIDSACRVDVHPLPVPPAAATAPWEAVRAAALQANSLDADSPALYLYPSRRAPDTPAITDYARESFAAGRGVLQAAGELMGRIHEEFAYDKDATTVQTPVWEAFDQRRGVCQDFAQVMICGLRGLGLPARYVSGYLKTTPRRGRPRLTGADATHAWVELWCGEAGWVGLDPTNNMRAELDHVILAVGRDYSDAAPIDGVLLGPGRQALEVAVDVIPEPEAEPVEVRRRLRWPDHAPKRLPRAGRSRAGCSRQEAASTW